MKYSTYNKSGHAAMSIINQKGIALPVTLILLFVLTLIGVATLRTSTFEESMAANSRLRQVAFNAAETTLSAAEATIVEELTGKSRRFRFFGQGNVTPIASSPGNTCDEGYCIPAKHNLPLPSPVERWEDPALNVWETASKHITYDNYIDTDLDEEGVIEAPRYIIEFLGNYDPKERNPALAKDSSARPEFFGDYTGNCRRREGGRNDLIPPNNVWPFCAADPGAFRITVRATAGPAARQAVVFLQSTVRIPFSAGEG